MLYRVITAVCSQIHTKHKYTVWGERRIIGCLESMSFQYLYTAVFIVTPRL